MGKAEGEDCGPEIAMTGESLFPIDALPGPIAQFATACAASLSAPVELVAIPALVVAAAAIANSRRIRLKPDWAEPASLFAVVVSPSGAMKSPALNMAAKPLQDLDPTDEPGRMSQSNSLLDYWLQTLVGSSWYETSCQPG
jgi:hypothetical protein